MFENHRNPARLRPAVSLIEPSRLLISSSRFRPYGRPQGRAPGSKRVAEGIRTPDPLDHNQVL